MTELTLVTRPTARLLLGLCLSLAALMLAARAAVALTTTGILDWDETYYASTTSTVAHGLGFYPYVLGYPPIPDMGGIGYVLGVYALAYTAIGPHLLSLRLVSLLASFAALAGLASLSRRWHGTAAALVTIAVAPALSVFQLTNSIRLDVVVVAFVAWVLVLFTHTRGRALRAHALLGLVLALGLEVHLHTAAAAFAIGVVYLAEAIRDVRTHVGASGWARRPLVWFLSGYAIGALLFLGANVLPNPTGFVRTAALARLSAADAGPQMNLTARMNGYRLTQTFVSPLLFASKEVSRYRQLAGAMSWWELTLWAGSLSVFLFRPSTPRGVPGRTLLLGAVAGGALVFNGPSPLYFSAILPFFVPAIGLFLSHGLARAWAMPWRQAGTFPLAAVAVISLLTAPAAASRLKASLRPARAASSPAPVLVTAVTRLATPACTLAGPTDLYAEYFMAYPKFIGTRRVEVMIGSTYYDLQDDLTRYWRAKNPDFAFGPLDTGLAAFVSEAGYKQVAQSVWRKPDDLSPGCGESSVDRR